MPAAQRRSVLSFHYGTSEELSVSDELLCLVWVSQQQGFKLFVGNLSFRTESAGLRDAFEPFGRIVFSTVIENRETGQSR